MLVLVTQADGSARRLTWLSFALAIFLVAAFLSASMGGGSVQKAIALRVALLDYFDEHPYVEIQEPHRAILPASYTDAVREEFVSERRRLGLPILNQHTVQRAQQGFDDLLLDYAVEIEGLPAWRYGVSSQNSPVPNDFLHIGVHETRTILILTLLFFLIAAIPLEDGWGHIRFGVFAAAAIFLTAIVSRVVGYEEAIGMPWAGASGLVAACLGAYFVRSLRGSPRLAGMFPMPGFILVPLWVGIEYVSIRQMTSSDTFMPELAMIHAAGFAFGFAVSAVMMLLGVERKMIARASQTEELVSKPTLELAMQAREEGQHDVAFDLLKRGYRRASNDPDTALAFWDVAQVVGKAAHALDAILMVIRSDLESGLGDRAVRNYFLASDAVAELNLEPELCVRLGEALLDEGHPQDALRLLGEAVQSGGDLSTSMAQRVVRVARDLDPELTQRAAAIALQDPGLDPGERSRLEELSGEIVTQAPGETPSTARSQRPPGVVVVQPPPMTAPVNATAPAPDVSSVESDPGVLGGAENDAAPMLELDDPPASQPTWNDQDDELDPDALSEDALASEAQVEVEAGPEVGLEAAVEVSVEAAVEAGLDVELGASDSSPGPQSIEQWNDPGLIDDLGADLADDLGDLGDLSDLDPAELEQAARDAGIVNGGADDFGASSDTLPIDMADKDETITQVDPGVVAEEGPTAVNVPAALQARQADPVPELRLVRVRNAIPLRLEADAVVIEVDGGNKTRLPFERLEAVSVAAVLGIADKPVLIVDLVLNWNTAGEPLKLIRLRSDRFDPMVLAPDAGSPLDALRSALVQMLDGSNARPLPDRDSATGSPFGSHSDLASYQATVLGARD